MFYSQTACDEELQYSETKTYEQRYKEWGDAIQSLQPRVFVMSYSMLGLGVVEKHSLVQMFPYAVVVVDEFHTVCNWWWSVHSVSYES